MSMMAFLKPITEYSLTILYFTFMSVCGVKDTIVPLTALKTDAVYQNGTHRTAEEMSKLTNYFHDFY